MRYLGIVSLCFLLFLSPYLSKGDTIEGTAKTPIFTGMQPPDAIDDVAAKTQQREYWHPSLQAGETININCDIKYENIKDLDIPIHPIASYPLLFTGLKSVGYEIVPDIQITIAATCRALSKSYPEVLLYTGASVKGKITLEAKGLKLVENFNGKIEPPNTLPEETKLNRDLYKEPKGAPLYHTLFLPGSLVDKLARIYYKAFGPYTLVLMYVSGNPGYGTYYEPLDPLLEEIGEPLLEPFTYLLRSRFGGIPPIAAHALAVIKSPKAIPALLSAAVKGWWDDKEFNEALKTLAKEPNGVEKLLSCLRDKDPQIRRKAAEILGMVGGNKAVEGLISALKDKNLDVRMEAVKALSWLKDKRAVEALTRVVQDTYEDTEVRVWAARALGEIRDVRATEPLQNLLRNRGADYPELWEAVSEALAKISEQPLPLLQLLTQWQIAVEHRAHPDSEKWENTLKGYGTSVVEPLLPIVENSQGDEELRLSALRILSQIKDDRLLQPFLSLAKDDKESLEARCYAIAGLSNCTAKEASDFLIALLTDRKALETLRSAAAYALGEKKEKRAIEHLFFALKAKPSHDVGVYPYQGKSVPMYEEPLSLVAAKALVKIGEPAMDRIKEALRQEDPNLRLMMLIALGESEEQWAQELLLPLAIRDPDAGVRLRGGEYLVKGNDPEALNALLSILEDEQATLYQKGRALELLREFCYQTKIKFQDRRFLEPLLRYLKSLKPDDYDQARDVLEMLGMLKDTSAVEAIVPFLYAEEELVRESAVDALAEIGDIGGVMKDLLYMTKNDPSDSLRAHALGVLGKLKDPRGVNALVDAIQYDPNYSVRIAAIEALLDWKPPEAVEPLATFLPKCKDPHLKKQIADILAHTDRAKAANIIVPLLQSKEPEVRTASAESLGLLEAWEGVEPLIELLTDEDAEVRKSALNALQEITHNGFGYNIGMWRVLWERHKEDLARGGEIR